MKNRPFFITFSLFFFLIIFLGGLYLRGKFLPVDSGNKNIMSFSVNKGDGFSKTASSLFETGLIRSEFFFKIYGLFTGKARNIKAGRYELSPSMSYGEILSLLIKGTADKWVTIIEGLRNEEIGQLLIKAGFSIDPKDWESQIKSRKLEGKIFPDSYLIPPGASQSKILEIIEKNFQKKVIEGLGKEFGKSTLSLDQNIVLSSILEREVKTQKDREMVAGILLKRISNGWPLQVDASVQYAIASEKCSILDSECLWWPAKITYLDLKNPSPYNTYLYKGLPPAPICNPGLISIKAALNYQNSEYWFYISDKSGKIHYAKTLNEHQDNINKYLK